MWTLAVVNQKGGVGKTTTAVTVAHGLAMHGYRTLLVDLDAQGNCADALGMEKYSGLYQLLIGKAGLRAVTPGVREGLDVVASDKATVEAATVLAGMAFREQLLQRSLATLGKAGRYDVAVLDVAPGAGLLQIMAFCACSAFLIPVALDHLAVVGATDALASVASLEELGALEGRFLGVLPTMWERSTNESHEQLQTLAGLFKKFVWPPIPLDVRAREAPAHGMTLLEYAPMSRVVRGVELQRDRFVGGYQAVIERMVAEVGG